MAWLARYSQDLVSSNQALLPSDSSNVPGRGDFECAVVKICDAEASGRTLCHAAEATDLTPPGAKLGPCAEGRPNSFVVDGCEHRVAPPQRFSSPLQLMDAGYYNPRTEAEFWALQQWKYLFVVGISALLFDWCITLDLEVEHIWQRKWSCFSYLWIALRYFPILMYAVAAYTVFQTSWEPEAMTAHYPLTHSVFRCDHLAVLPTIFVIALVLIAHIVFALRTYALYGRSRMIIYVFAFDERLTYVPKGYGCIPASPRKVQGILTWSTPFVYDSMSKIPIVHIMIRDGVVYFGLMCLFYGVNVLLYIFAPEGLQSMNASFATTITVVCTQRVIFNLRHLPTTSNESPPETVGSRHVPYLSQPGALIETWLTDVGTVLDQNHERRPSLGHRRQPSSQQLEYAMHDVRLDQHQQRPDNDIERRYWRPPV
ncbi:hypothetical protein BKA62DRAFT_834411 [Auriculariales sp. MPI-PUGE-AT-0066]|nr:hypothetical protein BKA62DRAFT_834411 [Auriculariales sp. MPI-PUGE-AT-0066]